MPARILMKLKTQSLPVPYNRVTLLKKLLKNIEIQLNMKKHKLL